METAVIAPTTKLVFKTEIAIERQGTRYQIGNVRIPSEIFSLMDEYSTMELRSPWRLDPGERVVGGLRGLQRRLSSADSKDVRCFFIPSDYLLKIVED
jgi:hypothetical protein